MILEDIKSELAASIAHQIVGNARSILAGVASKSTHASASSATSTFESASASTSATEPSITDLLPDLPDLPLDITLD